jgi:hypothetical protein
MKKLFQLLLNRFINKHSRANEAELLAIGALLSKQSKQMPSTCINDHEFKIFSQWGDDGIIQYLINNIHIKNKTFIEFGVEDFLESNTRFLMINDNWEGFVMDGSEESINSLSKQEWFWKYSLKTKAIFINKENINELLLESGFKDLGLLHIDLDGNDYHILKSLDFKILNPSILITEYNSVFGNERAISVPYDENFYRTDKHYSNLYWGASLPALNDAASQKGYSLVGCNLAGNNAYFVRNDLLNHKVTKVSVKEGFKVSKYRESRNINGALSLLKDEERLKVIKGLEVLNITTGNIETL